LLAKARQTPATTGFPLLETLFPHLVSSSWLLLVTVFFTRRSLGEGGLEYPFTKFHLLSKRIQLTTFTS
jgi:hypothetical protein